MARTLLLSGFDLTAPDFADEVRFLLPPVPLPPLQDFRAACVHALEEPVAGAPLIQALRSGSKVCVVVDDLSLPVPAMSKDCRKEMLEAVLELCEEKGVRAGKVTVLIASGLSRQWRASELTEVFGAPLASTYAMLSHDAEAHAQLVQVGELAEGPVELNRAVVEADLVVHLNVVSLPLLAGWYGLLNGTAGYRTSRFLQAPQLFTDDPAPLRPGSTYHQLHQRAGALLAKKTRVLQLSAVLNNELFAPTFAALLQFQGSLTRPMQMWNALPQAVRHRAARLMRASYRPVAVFAGPPDEVAPRALEAFYRQHEVTADGEADVLVFGLPDIGPGSVGAAQNPILTVNLALGYVSQLFTGKPLLKQGGVVVFANPLTPSFDRRVHLPHEDFYEKVLRLERDPREIHQRFEPYFAGRPEFVSSYQRRYAFHGTHPLYSWYQCAPVRQRASRIIVAHGDPRACARLGLMPADHTEDAMQKALEAVGGSDPSVVVFELPPPFFVRVR